MLYEEGLSIFSKLKVTALGSAEEETLKEIRLKNIIRALIMCDTLLYPTL